jgi:predicted NBD/HSP70 family sugar kinase
MFSGTNLPRIGSYNMNVVLSAIQAGEGISRVEIAKQTGLTAQTVSVIVRRLIDQGIVEEGGPVPSGGGKPRTALRVNANASYAVGIHFDPIEVSVVVVDLMGRKLAHSRKTISPELEPEEIIAETADIAHRQLEQLGIPGSRILGVGAACPGPIDQDQGLVISPPRQDRWTQVPIKNLLKRYMDFDVIIDNDANAAAIGERWCGHGRTTSDFAFLYLGTGIGGAMFLSNEIYRGASRNAGEFGHIVVEPSGNLCYCGNTGCLESMCSPAAIVRAVRAELALGKRSSLSRVFDRDPELLDHQSICLAAVAEDPVARQVVDRVADYIGACAVVIANALDPDLLVIGGKSVNHVAQIYQQRVSELVSSRPLARKTHTMRVVISDMADAGAALGAASLVLHAAYSPSTADLVSA